MGASRTLQALEHTMMTIVTRSLAIALLLCSASFASHEVDAIVPEDAEVFSDVYEKAATKVPSTDVVQLQDGSGSTHNHEDHASGSAHVNEGHPEASSAASQQECSPGCRVGWEKDNWCDHKCNNAACNWDNGRCGGHASSSGHDDHDHHDDQESGSAESDHHSGHASASGHDHHDHHDHHDDQESGSAESDHHSAHGSAGGYTVVTSGSCASHNMRLVKSETECGAARAAFGIPACHGWSGGCNSASNGGVVTLGSTHLASGCSYVPSTGKTFMNFEQDHGAPCSSSNRCLCSSSSGGSSRGYINMGSFAGMGCCQNGIMRCGDSSLQGKPCREGTSGQGQEASSAAAPTTAAQSSAATTQSGSGSARECSPGCRVGWEKDNYCDHACNNAACNLDNGRCGGHASSSGHDDHDHHDDQESGSAESDHHSGHASASGHDHHDHHDHHDDQESGSAESDHHSAHGS